MTSTNPEMSELTRADLLQFKMTPMKLSRTWFTPDVILLESVDSRRYVLKDVASRPLMARLLWCRKSVKREVTALQRLDGIPGVPKVIHVLDRDAFVMEWINARPLPAHRNADQLGADFFVRLTRVVQAMHDRGVAHGDLRRRNILVTSEKEPCIIDFETAILTHAWGPRQYLCRFLQRVDRLTILKIFGRYYPHALTEEEATSLQHLPLGLRAGRFFRRRIYRPLSPKIFRKRIREWKHKRKAARSHNRQD